MDGAFDRCVVNRVPLAESVLTLMRWTLDADLLEATYQTSRGRCHTRLLGFPTFVQLLFDSLTGPWPSARAALVKAEDEGRLPVSLRAFYDKLENTPLAVSLNLFREATQRLRLVVPEQRPGCPPSLQGFTTLLMDGKVVKHVCRRLKALRLDRSTACKLLGPRTLVVADRWTGLLHDLVADLDGEANEVKYAGLLLQRVAASVPGPWLIAADRAFGVFQVCKDILHQGGHFVIRKHAMTRFVADPQRPAVHSTDRFGRPVIEEWGWIIRGKNGRERIAVRQISVRRNKESLVLLSSLLDATTYPVDDLLDSYLARWDIEGMFQQVTEVFHLRTLISSSPQGMLAQLVIAFLMYNVVQTVKQFIAGLQQRDVQTISTTMLFRDIREELISLRRLLGAEGVVAQIEALPTMQQVRTRVEELLRPCWCNRWVKANHRPRNPAKAPRAKPARIRQTKGHDSVQRILEREHSQ